MRDDLSLSEYNILLAEAFDAEELDALAEHNRTVGTMLAFNAPRKIKKWKWSSIDKAGTVGTSTRAAADGISALAFSALSKMKSKELVASGSIRARADATGRRIIYMDDDPGNFDETGYSGYYFDEAGNITKRKETDLIVRFSTMSKEVH